MADGIAPYSNGQIWDAQDANSAVGLGDGTDGAFSENSGTTNLTQGTPYQYTSFLLDTNATLSASSTSTYPIIIFVQGNVVINGTINLLEKGCAGGAAENNGTGYHSVLASAGTSKSGTAGIPGIRLGPDCNFQYHQKGMVLNGTGGGGGYNKSGGGGGASSQANGGGGGYASGGNVGGVGGNGGCSILIICGGTLTFGAASSIDVSGADGASGTAGDSGGGGGGGSGDIIIIHKGAKTDNGLATTKDGGTGGAGEGGGGVGGAGAAGNEVIELFDITFM